MYKTLISAEDLKANLDNRDWVIIDARFSLADSEAGGKAYRFGHLPNARYAHLDRDLSSAINSSTGRHPLPDLRVLVKQLGTWGISNHSQVIIYDDTSGAFAGRLWWLLRTLGHEQVAVLNGGIKRWQALNYPLTTVLPTVKTTVFRAYLDDSRWLSAQSVQDQLAQKQICLLDARTPERFQGKQEPIDPIAGHIPGALNRPFQSNLDANGLFLSANSLRQSFLQQLDKISPTQTVHMCGSGVTACHNLLAMEHAGLNGSKLYAGSWSEWIRNKNRRIATT